MSEVVRWEIQEKDDDVARYGRCFMCGEVFHSLQGFDKDDRLVEFDATCGCGKGENLLGQATLP